MIRRRSVTVRIGERLQRRLREAEERVNPPDRIEQALTLTAQTEAYEAVLPTAESRQVMWARGRVARRAELPEALLPMLPEAERSGWATDADDVREVRAGTAADLVVLGKLDLQQGVKLRSVYHEAGLVLAAQPPSATGVDGIARMVRAHQVVGEHAPQLITGMAAHGRLPVGLPYLVEDWVDGTVLTSRAELPAVTGEILDGLAAVHQGYGTTAVPLPEHWPHLLERWEETLGAGLVPGGLGRWVESLVRREGTLRRSWSHGDLVASNVMRTPRGVLLLDWEQAGEAPVMNDAAKLHLFSADPEAVLRQVLSAFGASSGMASPGSGGASSVASGRPDYSPAEELALAHAQLISLYPRRRARLAGHPRAGVYERQIRRQVQRLQDVADA